MKGMNRTKMGARKKLSRKMGVSQKSPRSHRMGKITHKGGPKINQRKGY